MLDWPGCGSGASDGATTTTPGSPRSSARPCGPRPCRAAGYIARSSPPVTWSAESEVSSQNVRGISSPGSSTRTCTTRRARDQDPARYGSAASQTQVRGSSWHPPFSLRKRTADCRIPLKTESSESFRGLSEPVGIHLSFALGLSNEVGPLHPLEASSLRWLGNASMQSWHTVMPSGGRVHSIEIGDRHESESLIGLRRNQHRAGFRTAGSFTPPRKEPGDRTGN